MIKTGRNIIMKRMICAALVAALMLSIAGCGANVKNDMTATEGITAGATAGDTKAADGTSPALSLTEAAEDVGAYSGEAADADFAMAAADIAAEGAEAKNAATEGLAATEDESTQKVLPEAGQLTAGQWSDNENWGFFSNLIASNTLSFPAYGLDPVNRIAVTVTNASGKPVANAKANLVDKDGKVIFSGVSDKEGIVYLFDAAGNSASVEIESGGKKQSAPVSSASADGQNGVKGASGQEITVVIDDNGSLYKDMDIMFIVDTTASMSDEMLFLQSEFTAITEAVGTDHTRYSVNFYRDEGDDYVTKCSDFSTDIKKIQKSLNKETADGGGDYPEAVADILTETMSAKDWNDDSVKLAFMIFDAPPHDGKEKELTEAIEAAAAKGIHIIPVISSDSDRSTELFGRAMAIMTDGTYVFLTDDSGIGNSHEEPIIGSYEVRPLYDIIIDVINSYRQ